MEIQKCDRQMTNKRTDRREGCKIYLDLLKVLVLTKFHSLMGLLIIMFAPITFFITQSLATLCAADCVMCNVLKARLDYL